MVIQQLMESRHGGGQVVEEFNYQLSRNSEKAMVLARSAKSQERLSLRDGDFSSINRK